MSKPKPEFADETFLERRVEARKVINKMDSEALEVSPERDDFFKSVYELAGDDAAQVPWADMKPKDELVQWLEGKHGINLKAIDIACGLGDHAELMASHGYETTAFDISPDAIDWARKRFPNSNVDYQTGDLFDPPKDWIAAFDLVWECYTIQALHPDLREKTSKAVADLVAPNGTLLVYTRLTNSAENTNGPPWPLTNSQADISLELGFEKIADRKFDLVRPDKTIPHRFTEWRKL